MDDSARVVPTSQRRRALWAGLAAVATLGLALTTLQTQVNGSPSPYATDVGEIQNALPRWGTLHFTGYPLYSLTGSLFVTLLRWVGVAPAAGASLVSALWGAAAAGLLAALAMASGASGPAAFGGALVAALSLSAWIDASLAEVHTMTMALTVASLLLAVRYRHSGSRGDLLWLTLAFTQGVAHQRAIAFLAPSLVVLIAPRWREAVRHVGPVLGVALLAPLTYLYLPIRYWQGAEWTFGQPGTWHGFWEMIADTKAERIVSQPGSLGEWWQRALTIVRLLGQDLPLGLLALGLAGVWFLPRRERWLALGLTLAWLPYLILCAVIWEGDVSDALLAVKLPLPYMAGVGLALIATRVSSRGRVAQAVALGTLAAVVAYLIVGHRPRVLAITQDRTATAIVETVAALEVPSETPVTLVALWGHEYWALRYAQTYEGRFPELNLVDHNADMRALLDAGHRLWTPTQTFYRLPLAWWEKQLGEAVHLCSVSPGVIEIATKPRITRADVAPGTMLDLGNGLQILSASLSRQGDRAVVTVYWEAHRRPERDYSVGVHLLAEVPPNGPEDIIAQADRQHPVDGWYPTTLWMPGEIVRDHYVLTVPAGTAPVGVRVGMYYQEEDGRFVNSPWPYLPW